MESGNFENDWAPIQDDEVGDSKLEKREYLRCRERCMYFREWEKRHPGSMRERKRKSRERGKSIDSPEVKRRKERKREKKKYAKKKAKRLLMPRVICLYGASGSGKTLASLYLQKHYGINLICSYTTRPMREGEIDGIDHRFVSEVPPREEMIAYTQYGGYEYWALKSDIKGPVTVYVVDEEGIRQLRQHKDQFRVFSVKISRTELKRRQSGVSEERIERDKHRNDNDISIFKKILNNKTQTEFFQKLRATYKKILVS